MAIPLSYHRITKSYFRTCSTRRCHSQAPFCLCTLRMISNHSEGTFARLRYSFGGDRPSQTARLTMSPDRIHGRRLEFQQLKGGIPRVAPPKLTPGFLCLPPILYMKYRNPILKGWYPNSGSPQTGVHASQPPTYPVHSVSNPSIKLE